MIDLVKGLVVSYVRQKDCLVLVTITMTGKS